MRAAAGLSGAPLAEDTADGDATLGEPEGAVVDGPPAGIEDDPTAHAARTTEMPALVIPHANRLRIDVPPTMAVPGNGTPCQATNC
jgi:hypothetical protein